MDNLYSFSNSNLNNLLLMIKQPKRGGRPVRHSAGMTAQEKQIQYQRGLSRIVGEACDKFFERKGIAKSKSWKEQNNDHFKRKAR